MDEILGVIRESLASIDNPRFYDTERGYQGELATEISKRFPALEIEGAIVEQEYQKRMFDHGFRIRPDIILHIPYEQSGLPSRTQGNFAVIELKLNSMKEEALEDYQKLSQMCDVLDYPLAIFININSDITYFADFEGRNDPRIRSFAVQIKDGNVNVVEGN